MKSLRNPILLFLIFAQAGTILSSSESFMAHARKKRGHAQQQKREIIRGRVVQVSDGDTLRVLETSLSGEKTQTKVRLDGIDAPEKKQPFGEACRKKLAGWVAGKEVEVLVRKKDRYGRSLGLIQLGSTAGVARKNINLLQVEEGCAWFYRHYAHEHSEVERDAFERAESAAKKARKGLWSELNPTPPWQFRQAKRERSRKKQKRGQSNSLFED
jgi:micrococcal nuclease